jgi:type I restriction enzyme R subunit
LPVDTYDCIVVDECHRGYALDRELSEAELTFRDEADYISKYRRVLDHFDAVKIGLTATPALHTVEIFGQPIYSYSYRQAVIDGWLVDHEPPLRIVTRLAEDGITWKRGEVIQTYLPFTGEIDPVTAVQLDGATDCLVSRPSGSAASSSSPTISRPPSSATPSSSGAG